MKWAFSTLVIFLSLVLNACSDSNSTNFGADPAEIRFVNLVPNAPTLIFELNDTLFAEVSYAQSSSLRSVSASTFNSAVSYLNADADEAIEVFRNESFGTVAGREYSVIISGSLDSPTVTVIDTLSTGEITSGTTELHFFNGSSLASGVDVYLSENISEASINGLSPMALTANGSTLVQTTDSGKRRLLVTATGDDTVIYDGGVIDLISQTRRLYALVDNFNIGSDIRAIQIGTISASGLVDERLPTRFRVANMIADIAAVDINLDGVPIFEDLAFEQISSYLETATAQYEVTTTLVDQPAMVLHTLNRQFIAGESRTYVVTGSSATGQVQGRIFLDDRRPVQSGAQVRIINAAADAASLDVYFLVPEQLVTDAVARIADFTLLTTSMLLLEGSEYDVVFTGAGEDTILAGPQRISIANGGIYSVIVRDASGGGTPGGIVIINDVVE